MFPTVVRLNDHTMPHTIHKLLRDRRYRVKGELLVCFCTVELNFLRNLQSSLLPMVLTTDGGAHPPGFTEEGGRGGKGGRGGRGGGKGREEEGSEG